MSGYSDGIGWTIMVLVNLKDLKDELCMYSTLFDRPTPCITELIGLSV